MNVSSDGTVGTIRSQQHGHQPLLLAATLTQGAESQGKGGYAGRRREDDQRSACREDESASRSRVRRFVVDETEALQGFPRGWTMIPYRGKPAKDGPRYRAVGNAMAVPVVRWIGERIALFEEANR
jgi:DNA (cytosine-5)-methyltransferase 1